MLLIYDGGFVLGGFYPRGGLSRGVLSYTRTINPLPDMPILGSSNSAANKDMTSKIWTNGVTFI